MSVKEARKARDDEDSSSDENGQTKSHMTRDEPEDENQYEQLVMYQSLEKFVEE